MNDINANGFRTSPQQERMVSLLGSKAAQGIFHKVEMRLHGRIDPERFWNAVRTIRAQHEILRTRVLVGPAGSAVQVVTDASVDFARDGNTTEVAPWQVSLIDEGAESVIRVSLNVLNGDSRSLPQLIHLLSETYREGPQDQLEIMQYPDLAEAFHELLSDAPRASYWKERQDAWTPEPGVQPSAPGLTAGSLLTLTARSDLNTVMERLASTPQLHDPLPAFSSRSYASGATLTSALLSRARTRSQE
jgi:hypothetical protein